MKKILSFLLVMCFILSSLTFFVSAEDEYEEYDGMVCVKGELVVWTNVYVEPVICEDGESVDFFGISVTEIDALFTTEDGGADRWAELSDNRFPYCIKVASDVDTYGARTILLENENIIEVSFNQAAYVGDPPEFTESVFEFVSFDEQAMSDLGFEPTLYGKDFEPIVIDSRETIDALANCGIDNEMSDGPSFDEYFAKYDETFFESNALVVVFAEAPNYCGYKYEVFWLDYTLTVDGLALLFNYRCTIPWSDGPAVNQMNFVMAEVKKEDIADIVGIKANYIEVKISEDVEFTESIFTFENFDEQAMSDLGFEPTYYGKDFEPIVIDSRETIDALSNCFESDEKTDFDEYFAKYDEAFFENNALITVFAVAGNPGYKYDVRSLKSFRAGQQLALGYKCISPRGEWPDVCRYDLIMAEVKKADISEYISISAVCTEAEPDKEIEYTESIFTFENYDEQAMSDLGFEPTYYGKDFEPIVIDSRETIDALANCFEYGEKSKYDEYFAKYDEAFFENNALIVVFAKAAHPGYKYEVLSLEYDEDGETLVFSFEYKIPLGNWPDVMQYDLIMAEVEKVDIGGGADITAEYSEFKNIWGDVNGDQAVNSYDYLMAKRAAFGTYTLDEEEFERADVYIDRNYEINSADYLLIKRIAFGTYEIW